MGLALSLISMLATGQVATINLDINSQTSVSVSAGSCGSSLQGNISMTWSGYVSTSLKLWATSASECADTPTSGTDLIFTEVSQTTLNATTTRNYTGSVQIPVSNLPTFANAGDGGTACGASGVSVTHKFCASVVMCTDLTCIYGKNTAKPVTPVSIVYDTQAPLPPTLTEAEGFENAASVTVAANDADTATVDIQSREMDGGTDFVTVKTVTKPGSVTIPNLRNGTVYELRAIAYDAVTPTPNASDPSEIITVTPRESTGFWDACRAAGCQTGGCNSMAAGPLGLAVLALAVLVRRMRR